MSTLASRVSLRIDASVIAAVAPRVPAQRAGAQKAIIAAFGDMMPDILVSANISTELRIEHMLAQVAHESDGFCTLEEYASGAAYEGRRDLGNTKPGDGKRYKGRGPIQLTGGDNYRGFTAWMRRQPQGVGCPDFEKNPELVATWPWAGWALAFYWASRPGLNIAADRDDLVAVTELVNGGKNGLAQRAAYLAKAKLAVVSLAGNILSAEQQYPVLVRGMSGEPVEALQRALQAAGYYLLTIDGQFGAGTEAALRTFQRARGLVVDGMAGAKTAAALGLRSA
jgi:putative chitinase